MVPDKAISPEGRTVRCAKCKHNWFQDGPQIDRPADVALSSPKPPQSATTQPEPNTPKAEPVSKPKVDASSTLIDEPIVDENTHSDDAAVPDPSISNWTSDDETDASETAINPVVSEALVDEAAGDPLPPPDFSEAVPENDDKSIITAASDTSTHDGIHSSDGYDDTDDDGIDSTEKLGFFTKIRSKVGSGTAVKADTRTGVGINERVSQFDYEPPFRARRNPLKLWTAAAVVFAVLAMGTVAAVSFYGAPSWLPIQQPTWAVAQPELELDFPPDQIDRRSLPNGTEYFGVSGTVTNTGRETVAVPSILIVLSDERDKPVYSWEITPPKAQLTPGETMTITEATTDVPRSAKFADIGWKPN